MKNPTLLQYFHWYYPDGSQLWPEVAERADDLNDIGINMAFDTRENLVAYGPHPAHQEVVAALREIADWVICDYEATA